MTDHSFCSTSHTSVFFHQFITRCLATRAAADTVLHVLTVRVTARVHNQTHFCIDNVVPRAVPINHPHPGIQPLIEPGTESFRIVDPRDLTVGTVPALSDFRCVRFHGITTIPEHLHVEHHHEKPKSRFSNTF